MKHTITISALEGGWSMQTDRTDAPMTFRSGAAAETAARRLAERLADVGEAAEVLVYLRDGCLGGRFITTPGPRP